MRPASRAQQPAGQLRQTVGFRVLPASAPRSHLPASAPRSHLAFFPALKPRCPPPANFPFTLGSHGANSAAVAGMDGGPASGSDCGAPGCSIRHQSHRGKRLGSVKGLLLPQAAVPRTADGRCDARVRQPLVAWPGSDAGCRLSPEARGCSPHLTAGNSLTSESASAEVATSRLAAQVLGLQSLW